MLNWLVIGIGDITSKRVIPAILEEPRSTLHAIVTRNPAKAAPYAAKVFADLTLALKDDAINAVYVASPVFLHAPQTVQALHSGRHVLCEKPMAMNYPETQTMVQAAAEAGKMLGIAYYRRTYPKVHRAIQLLQQGAIGRPVMAYVTCHNWSTPEGGDRGWLVDPVKAGGGPLFDIASHRIDLLNFIFGEPQEATGQFSNVVHPTLVEDNATALIEYKNGVRGIVDVRWHTHAERDEFRIIGTDGEMDLTPLNGPDLVYPSGQEQLPTHPNLHYLCVKNFVDAVLEGAPLLSSGSSAAWTDWATGQLLLAKRNKTAG
jgi:predicted dehydrogenase